MPPAISALLKWVSAELQMHIENSVKICYIVISLHVVVKLSPWPLSVVTGSNQTNHNIVNIRTP